MEPRDWSDSFVNVTKYNFSINKWQHTMIGQSRDGSSILYFNHQIAAQYDRSIPRWQLNIVFQSTRDVRPRDLASALRLKNLVLASASWVVASASWVLASNLEAYSQRGTECDGSKSIMNTQESLEFSGVSHASSGVPHAPTTCKLVLHLGLKQNLLFPVFHPCLF